MVNLPRPRALRHPGQSVLRNNTVFIGLPRGNGGSSSGPPSPPVSPANPPETVTYVAPNGSDITGERGNPLLPFATVQAALNASLDNDVVLLAPGTYAPVTIPPTLSVIGLKGMGVRNQAVIEAPPGTSPLTWIPDPGFRILALTDLTLRSNAPSDPAFFVSGNDGDPADAILGLSAVQWDGASGYAEYLFQIVGERCRGDLTLFNIQQGHFYQHNGTTLEIEIDEPAPPEISPVQPISFEESHWVEALLVGDFNFYADQDTEIEEIRATDFSTPMGDNAVFEFHGTCGDLEGAISSALTDRQVDISFATIGILTFQNTAPLGLCTINARGANIDDVVLFIDPLNVSEIILDTSGGSLLRTSGFSSLLTRWKRDGGSAQVPLLLFGGGINVLTFASNGGTMPGATFPSGTPVRYSVTPEAGMSGPLDSVWILASSGDTLSLVNDFSFPILAQIIYQLEPVP
jgi:hypothetical protein